MKLWPFLFCSCHPVGGPCFNRAILLVAVPDDRGLVLPLSAERGDTAELGITVQRVTTGES
jgi:hypothetical protein